MYARNYHTNMRSSLDYYYPNWTTWYSHIFVITKPYIYQATAVTDPGGWGERFYFQAEIYDEDRDNVTIDLYVDEYPNAPLLKNSTYIEAPDNDTITVSWKDDDCNNIGTWHFYLKATDNRTLNNQSSTLNFTVERDDVNFTVISGGGTTLWRHEDDSYGQNTTNLIVYVYDTDRQAILKQNSNASFWVTRNASDPNSWDSGYVTGTNSTSYINYNFPDSIPESSECNYTVGQQAWKAGIGGVFDDQCYVPTNSSDQQITIRSVLRPSVISPNGEGFLIGSPIPVVGYITDECYPVSDVTPVNMWRFDKPPDNYTRSQNPANQSNGWYNYTWTETGDKTSGYFGIWMFASKTYYENNYTFAPDAFFLAENPHLGLPSMDDSRISGWGEVHDFMVTVTDRDGNYNNITLWKRMWNTTTNDWDANWTFVNFIYRDGWWGWGQDTIANFNERFTCSDMG
jgi:hypothetical protein